MPGDHAEDSVGDCISSVLDDNPDLSEEQAARICEDQMKEGMDPEDVEVPSMKKSIKFKAKLTGGVQAIFKDGTGDDRFVIWGPASVEVVDKEGDKITAEALKDALPQLLRRSRLSLDHSDQLVGDILESFETDEPTTVKFNGHEVTRKEFPTDVLELDGMESSLFVAGEVWSDTRQAQETRKKIEQGEINSYSISGEAIASSTKVKDGEVYDEIKELDLSAVTLCKEGMNQKAGFGQVVKFRSDDAPSGQSSKALAVAKTDSNMSDDTDKSDEGEELLTREDLRSELKEAATEALDESEFVTADEVKSIVEEHGKADDEEDPEEEQDRPDNASEADAEADEEDEEKAHPEDEEAEDEESNPAEENEMQDDDDEEYEEEKDLDSEAVQDAVSALVNAYDNLSREEVENALAGLVEGADGDEQAVPDEGEEDIEASAYSKRELKEKLPDDLFEAAMEHLSDEAASEEVVEASDEEATGGDMDSAEKDLDKSYQDMDTQEYLTSTVAGPTPGIPEEEEDLEKSFEGDEETDVGESHALKAFYNDQEESFEA